MLRSAVLKKIVAVSLLGALCFAAWVLVVSPIMAQFASYEVKLERTREIIERHAKIIQARKSTEKKLEAIKESEILNKGFIRGKSPELELANLQARIKTSIDQTDAELLSVQALPIEAEDEFSKLAIRVRMSGDIKSLARTFYVLETGWPVIFTDRIDIRVETKRRRRRGNENLEIENLRIQFDAYGYFDSGAEMTGQVIK